MNVQQFHLLFRILLKFLSLWLACANKIPNPPHVVWRELDDVREELIQGVILVGEEQN